MKVLFLLLRRLYQTIFSLYISHINKRFVVVILLLFLTIGISAGLNQRINTKKEAKEIDKQTKEQKFIQGEVIVKLKKNIDVEELIKRKKQKNSAIQNFNINTLKPSSKTTKQTIDVFKKAGVIQIKPLIADVNNTRIKNRIKKNDNFNRIYLLKINKKEIEDAITELNLHKDLIEYAEPNYIYTIERIPNDLDFAKQWGLHNTSQTAGTADADIDAPEAWNITTGNPNVIVAVVDTGIDYTHPDLLGNLWVNKLEAKGKTGVDDDGNGYIDDIYGCNTIDGKHAANGEIICGSPLDDNGHGSHVAGIIGAKTNNKVGVAGVTWNAKLMAIKFLNRNGSGNAAAAAVGIKYAVDNGAKILNNSWGGGPKSQTLQDAISYANTKNVLFVAAAGNSTANNDLFSHYPSNYNIDNIIAVAATDKYDHLASYSNYGINSVDLAAPGSAIRSTWKSSGYNTISGTSMATPFVSGVSALLLSQNSTLTPLSIKQRLLSSTDNLLALNGYTISGGRLNAKHALQPSQFIIYPEEINIVLNKDESLNRKLFFTNNSSKAVHWRVVKDPSVGWVNLDIASGTVLANSTTEIVLNLSSADLESHLYTTTLKITTDASEAQSLKLPITLTVRINYWGEEAASIGGSMAERMVAAVQDTQGNIYQVLNTNSLIDFDGTIYGKDKDNEILLIKYDSDHKVVWVKQIGNAVGTQNATDLAIDKNDNLYLAGSFTNSVKLDQFEVSSNKLSSFAAMIDKFGTAKWLRTIDEITFNTTVVISPLEMANGEYVVGYATGQFTTPQYWLKGFHANGTEKWRKQTQKINDLITETNGFIYGTGKLPLLILNSSGDKIAQVNKIDKFGEGKALAHDKNNNIYLTGVLDILISPYISPQDRDIVVAKFTKQGEKIWDKRFYGPIGEESGNTIVIGDNNVVNVAGNYSGDIYIDGNKFTNGIGNQDDIFVVSLDSQGRLLSFYSLGNPTYTDYVNALLVDDVGKLDVFGSFKSRMKIEKQYLYSKGDYDTFRVTLRPDRPFPDFHPVIGSKKAVYITSGGYIELEDRLNKLLLFPQGTIEFWLKTEINQKQPQSILFRGRTQNNGGWIDIYHSPNDLNGYKDTYIHYSAWRPDKLFPINRWVHVAFVRDGKKLTLYLNGAKEGVFDLGTDDPIPQYPTDTLNIGAQQIHEFWTNLPFQGAIDALRFSNTKRNVEQLWATGAYFLPFIPDANTIGLWQFDDNLTDQSKNNIQVKRNKNTSFVNGIVGNMPTATPTLTVTPTPTSDPCPNFASGNADCSADGVVGLMDFVCWKYEYINKQVATNCGGVNNKSADFNKNGTVDLFDFVIWLAGFKANQ